MVQKYKRINFKFKSPTKSYKYCLYVMAFLLSLKQRLMPIKTLFKNIYYLHKIVFSFFVVINIVK